MTRLMIADDNKDLCLCMSNSFTNENNIKIVNISVNGLQALTYYTELKPDVLLLDLNMPGLSGIDILNYLNECEKDNIKKNVIVLSSDSSLVSNIYNHPKVYSYFPKPYDFSKLLETIYDVNNSNEENKMLEKSISNLLWNLKFNPYTKGTSYLKDAITLAYNNNSYLYNNKELMKIVSDINHINEKAVRSSIDQILYKLSIPTELNSFFYDNYDGGKPSLKIFIAECVNYLRNLNI